MADSLGVPATQLGHADVAEHVKRSLQDARAQLTEQRDRERAAFQQEHGKTGSSRHWGIRDAFVRNYISNNSVHSSQCSKLN